MHRPCNVRLLSDNRRFEAPVPPGGVLPLVAEETFIARTGIFFTYDKSKLQRQSAFSGGEA
jgi:hypothetical protein